MTASADIAATPAGRLAAGDTWARLARACTAVATHLPAAVMAYALIVWPLLFGDSEVSLSEAALGWLAQPPPKDESVLKLVAYPTFFGLAAICFLATAAYRNVPWSAPAFWVLALFVGFAALSGAWSEFPSLTLSRAVLCGAIAATLLCAMFGARDYTTVAAGLFWTFFAVTALNIAAVFVRPPSEIGYTGIYPHKNVFGYVSALILYFGLHGVVFGERRHRLAAIPMLLCAPVFLAAAESKTSAGLAGLAPVAGLVLCGLRRRMGLSPLVVFVLAAVGLVLIFWLGRDAGVWDFASLNQRLLGSATLTGRTEIWDVAALLSGQRPWLGWGYEAVWNLGADGVVTRNAVGFVRVMPTAHNGYVDALVQLGAVGLAIYLAFVAFALLELGRLIDVNARLGWFTATLFTFVLLHNLLESDLLVSSNQLSMLFLIYLFAAIRARHESARPGGALPAAA
ncbi:O-antigen ligase family protein [Enterovirga sp.]|uniref:O-antigen ligase family protein n=1 Tax=Enterovirga sp. TaxID=2026350 RepID=UPI00261ECED9|nr:O-antigen ligase family protein [Enterovirga sp.]MDB5591873.1 hypothetical protein [Enterovirga sp.]